MANRRMFAKNIIDKDAFTEMPHSTQLLYFYLGMNADDDGFLDNYNGIMRNIGCKVDDIKLLVAKGFLILFDTGVMVIRDWRIHNQIRKDRYHPTKYLQELQQLQVLPTDEYALVGSGCQIGNQMATEVSLGKSSLGKVSIGEPTRVCACEGAPATPPTIDEVKAYCTEQGITIDVDCFYNYYASRGWQLDGQAVKSWQALVKCWASREVKYLSQQTSSKSAKSLVGGQEIARRDYSDEDLNALFTDLKNDN